MKVGDLLRDKYFHDSVVIVLSVLSAERFKVCTLDGLTMVLVLDPFDPLWEVISESR